MGALGAAGLLLRRLRAERGIVVLICLVVAATSFLFAAAPRAFNGVTDDALRYAVRVATPTARDVTMSLIDEIPAGRGRGIDGIRAYGDDLAEQLPPLVAAVIGAREDRFTTVRLLVPDPPRYETHVSLRYQDGVKDRTQLVSGRWPVDLGVPLHAMEPGDGTPDDGQAEPVVVEVAISAAAATEIGFGLGDRIPVTIDGSDVLVRGLGITLAPTEVEVVGLFDPLDPEADAWVGDPDLLQVVQRGNEDKQIGYLTAFVAAEAYPSLAASDLPFHYDWRFRVDPDRLDADQIPALQVDLRRVGFITGGGATALGTPVIVTGLPRIIDRYASERALSASVLSIAAVGPFGLAGGAVAMLALLLVRQRRAALALVRGRGASSGLLLGAQLWEGTVLVGAASLLGLLAAVALVDARASALSPVLGIGSGGLAIVLVAGATWPLARRPLGLLERDDAPILRVAPRRLVAELTVVAVALGAALLLRQRGLTFDTPDSLPQPDPLLAAVPVLSGVAAGIIVLRLYPLPIAALGWLAARGRGFVAVLGLRTIERHPAAANLPILVLMLTAAFAGFSSVIVSSLERGQLAASYLRVGADYRIEQVGLSVLDPSLDPATVPGVEAVARGVIARSARFSSRPYQNGSIYLLGIDSRAYDAVTAGLPADPHWPAAFLGPPDVGGLGTKSNPIPAILSDRLPAGSADVAPGDTFQMTVSGQQLTFQLAERRASFAGVPEGFTFAVVPFDWVEAALPGHFLAPSALWVRASDGAAGSLAAAVAEHSGSARIVSRPDAYAELHDAPLVRVIGAGYSAALVVAAIYMALTMVGALVLTAARSSRDTAYLRTLGVTARQTLGLTILEHALPALLAIVPGIALGIGVAILCEPGLGLATFVGSDVPLFVDWPAIGAIVAALVGVVAIAVVAGTWLARRARPADALRVDDD